VTTLLTSSSELEWRISCGTARLRRDGFDGAIAVGNANRFYLSGTIQQGHLLLPAEGEPLLLIRRGLDRARRVGPPNLEPLGSFRVELVEVEVEVELELAPPAWPPVGWVSTLRKLKDLSTYTVTGTPCVFTTCSWWRLLVKPRLSSAPDGVACAAEPYRPGICERT